MHAQLLTWQYCLTALPTAHRYLYLCSPLTPHGLNFRYVALVCT